ACARPDSARGRVPRTLRAATDTAAAQRRAQAHRTPGAARVPQGRSGGSYPHRSQDECRGGAARGRARGVRLRPCERSAALAAHSRLPAHGAAIIDRTAKEGWLTAEDRRLEES